MQILLHGPDGPAWAPRLRADVADVTVETSSTEDEAVARIAAADAFFGNISPRMLTAATHLQWIQTPMAGLERYFFPELQAHPVVVTNMRGIFHDMIPDQVMAYVLAFARDLHSMIRRQLERRWAFDEVRVLDLTRMTMGIVGLGGIGLGVARRARPHGLRIIAVDPRQADCPADVDALWGTDRLDDLLGESDFVVVCAPETPETRGLFDAEKFARMKAGSYFINIGRGRVVRLDPLVAALTSGHLAGAALDVFEVEPLAADHPLWGMANVIVTPHTAGVGAHPEDRRYEILLENVRRFTSGAALHNVVDKYAGF
jgi:phosphoglycerate dehydrogenase-like enzyme